MEEPGDASIRTYTSNTGAVRVSACTLYRRYVQRRGAVVGAVHAVVGAMPLSRLVAASPADVAVDSRGLAALFDRVRQEVSHGRVQGCQVAVARHGRLAGSASFGCGGGKPVVDDTLFACFSCTKAVGGIAVLQLLEEGLVSLDDYVADIIPGFGTHGKDAVTLRHLVTFTAGFPDPAGNRVGGDNLIVPADFSTSAARCAEFAKWELAWAPGSKWEYHVR